MLILHVILQPGQDLFLHLRVVGIVQRTLHDVNGDIVV